MIFNREEMMDKIYGCWIGKSIGGTLGAPFEMKKELLDISGFHSEPGKPLPNDDLDLQLIWLKALEAYGPLGVNERILGEYWINFIPPNWNEYGIGKANMKAGIPPPLSGDYNNPWKHSNGAWIRSEIWACCTPGRPDLVTKYAYYDACVDHGTGEGTYAEIFTATVEAAAFVIKDAEKLIDIGLSYLPKDCRVTRSIRIVLDGYHSGIDWREVRQQVLDDSEDLGWFQAPANLAFVVIGWLYGSGDFKKSLIIAVNCGDDTDCTGATIGSILGIIGGFKSIPEDWTAYVGDEIISIAIDRGSIEVPTSCTDLARRTLAMMEQLQLAYETGIRVSDEPSDLSDSTPEALYAGDAHKDWLSQMDGSIVYDFIHTRASVKYISGIDLSPWGNGEIEMKMANRMPSQQHYSVSYILPDGFELVDGPKHVVVMTPSGCTAGEETIHVTVKAGEEVEAVNRGIIEIIAVGRPTAMLIPILFLGK